MYANTRSAQTGCIFILHRTNSMLIKEAVSGHFGPDTASFSNSPQ